MRRCGSISLLLSVVICTGRGAIADILVLETLVRGDGMVWLLRSPTRKGDAFDTWAVSYRSHGHTFAPNARQPKHLRGLRDER